jgi:glycosyltransferase involved in cell wall biosynthesis
MSLSVGHYVGEGLRIPGGVSTYLQRLMSAQQQAGIESIALTCQPLGAQHNNLSNLVISDAQDLVANLQDLKLDILHFHITLENINISSFLEKIFDLPLSCVRSIHTHQPYCPSGGRFLSQTNEPCPRQYSLAGCLYGRVINHCGSLRPKNLYQDFQRTFQDRALLSEIPVITHSHFVKDQMIRAGYCAENIDVVLLPAPRTIIANAEVKPPKQEIAHFLYLGRIVPQKGWEWLLRAFAQVEAPSHLDIAGTGSPEQERAIRELAERLSLGSKITFHGWVDSVQALELLQNARALIFPSVWHEPAGLVTLEAAAVGRAVIASNVGGIPEYINALNNGLLVMPNDIQGLTQAIELLARDEDLAAQLGQTGRQNVEKNFDLAAHVQAVMCIYSNLKHKKHFSEED